MAPKYKLTYFNLRGLAETTRLLFALAGTEYEDVRIERYGEEWPKLKPSMPFNQMPILEVDGHVIAQSRAISRFVARELGYAGKNNIEAALCDMLVDSVHDLFPPVHAYRAETDEKKKEEMKAKFLAETLPTAMKNWQKILKANHDGQGFYVGDSVTIADIYIANFLWNLRQMDPASVPEESPAPLVREHVIRVLELPAIKAWCEKRPVTPM